MPFKPGVGGGSHPGNPNGKRGRPHRPVPEQITHIRLDTKTPLPCSVRNFDNPSGICGKPALVASVSPYDDGGEWATPGRWIVQPVCRECTAAMAKVYE